MGKYPCTLLIPLTCYAPLVMGEREGWVACSLCLTQHSFSYVLAFIFVPPLNVIPGLPFPLPSSSTFVNHVGMV